MMSFDQIATMMDEVFIGPLRSRVMSMINKIRVESTDDSLDIQRNKVIGFRNENFDEVDRYQDFGFSSNPPDGSEGVILFVNSNRDHPVIISVEDRRVRPTGLAKGESQQYNAEGDTIHIKLGGEIEITAASKVVLNAPEVELGDSASESVVLGDSFKTYFDTHTHTSAAPGSPTTPPVVPMPGSVLSSDVVTK